MPATYNFGNNPPIDYPRMLIYDTDMTQPIFQDSEILAAANIIPTFVITPGSGNGQFQQPNFTQPSYYRQALKNIAAVNAPKSEQAHLFEESAREMEEATE